MSLRTRLVRLESGLPDGEWPICALFTITPEGEWQHRDGYGGHRLHGREAEELYRQREARGLISQVLGGVYTDDILGVSESGAP
jgi:hypothetical protein